MGKFASAYYQKNDKSKIQCNLCPHNCKLKTGQAGICRTRVNREGRMYNLVYGKICSLSFDPIEKKPLYHFYPGKKILSIGTLGCNFRCGFCQNWEISQAAPEEFQGLKSVTSDYLLDYALTEKSNIGIAYTYNEPFVNFEFVIETARKFSDHSLKNVMVTNGYFNADPLKELCEVTDAFNVDLKAFHDKFYRKQAGASLQPVLDSIRYIAKSNSHLELTHLVIPGLNDDIAEFEKMLAWIRDETGENTVLHLSRYFPRYKLRHELTPEATLNRFYDKAREYLHFVYLGNIASARGQNTICPVCQTTLISRNAYLTQIENLDKEGRCAKCQTLSTLML